MKKTLTVNLNNIVFHVDDDAYEMLQTYLHDIAEHFQSEDEKKEIMNDVEARIAELFSEKLQRNKNVINLEDVQEVIEIMGTPSQYADEEEEPQQDKSAKKTHGKSRSYYRDPENAVLGGVASGLAAYFNIDVTWIRILLVVLVFVGVGFIIPVYLVVWVIAPAAVTAAQRLEMQGEDVTVESIKTELNNARNYVQSDRFKQSAGTVGARIGHIIRVMLKVLFGFFGAILGLVGIVVVMALLMALFFLIFNPDMISGFSPDIVAQWGTFSMEKMVLSIVSIVLLLGSPIFILVYWAIRVTTGRQRISRTVSWVVLVLWLAGLFMFFSVGPLNLIRGFQRGVDFTVNWDKNIPVVTEDRTWEPFHAVEASDGVEVTFCKDSVQKLTVEARQGDLPRLITKVEDGVLKIYTSEHNHFFHHSVYRVKVAVDSISSITGKDAASFKSDTLLTASDLKIKLSDASKADLRLKVTGLFYLTLNDASKTVLAGNCNEIKVDLSDASHLEATEFFTRIAHIKVADVSKAQVVVSEELDAQASDVSKIECKGNPKKIIKQTKDVSKIEIE